MHSARKRATYQDLLDLPEHVVGEIIEGDLYASPRPASPHAHACIAISTDLFGTFDGPPGDRGAVGGWWILVEPELHFGADVLVPDLAGWKRERMPRMPSVAHFKLRPDWVCEVSSPSTAALDRNRKLGVYAREGIPHCWIVDPLVKTLEIFRLEGGTWVVADTYAGIERIRAEPFDAVELDLKRWWLES
jgi:Uma2 family endonuclease